MTIPLNEREQHFKSLLRQRQGAPFVQQKPFLHIQTKRAELVNSGHLTSQRVSGPPAVAGCTSLSRWERVRVRAYVRKQAPKYLLKQPCLHPLPGPLPKGEGVFQQLIQIQKQFTKNSDFPKDFGRLRNASCARILGQAAIRSNAFGASVGVARAGARAYVYRVLRPPCRSGCFP